MLEQPFSSLLREIDSDKALAKKQREADEYALCRNATGFAASVRLRLVDWSG